MQSKTQTLSSIAAIAIFVMLALACVTQKTYSSEERKMLRPEYKAFVEKKDGTKITGDKLKLPINIWGATKGIYLDGQEMKVADVVAFQNSKAYYRRFKDTWVKQLKSGKINLYYYETSEYSAPYYDGTKMVHGSTKTSQHFVFQKGNEEMIEASKTYISELLKDNQEAYEKFNETFKPDKHLFPKQLQNKPGKLFEIIDIYNR